MKRSLNEFCEINNIAFNEVINMYYKDCIENGNLNMVLNAALFIVNFNIQFSEAEKVLRALYKRFDFFCEV